jgi:LacI family transcriptional regulator
MAAVSISTVSRILNNSFKGDEATLKRVREIVEKLNYQPSPSARRLSGKIVPSKMIGIMAPFFINPFFVEVLKGIYRIIHADQFHAILYDVDTKVIKKSTFNRILSDRILDGVLLVNMHLNEEEYKAISRAMPCVLVAAESDRADSVIVDNYNGMVQGLEYLYSLGHRRIGFINNEKNIYETRIREKAFLDQARVLGIEYKIDYRNVDRRSGYLGAKNLLENNPGITCLMYYSDLMAFGGIDYLYETNLRNRISIIGFDGFEMTFQVNLATVVQPMEKMGEEGARILLQRIAGMSTARIRRVLDPWLFKGRTCMGVP